MPPDIEALLVEMARKSDREICGFIFQEWSIQPITNVAEGERDFKMHEGELIKFFQNYFNDVQGVYHSHPGGKETPSERDIIYAPARLRYWIVTPERVIEWEIKDGVATEVVPRVADSVSYNPEPI